MSRGEESHHQHKAFFLAKDRHREDQKKFFLAKDCYREDQKKRERKGKITK